MKKKSKSTTKQQKSPQPVSEVKFKTADKLTKQDELEFEVNRLRSLLSTCFMEEVKSLQGEMVYLLVDPLNRKVEVVERPNSGE